MCVFHYKGFTIYRRPLGIVICLNYTLQGYNSKSPRRTGLQRVFVRRKRLYTRPPLSLPCPEPTLHAGGGHVSGAVAPSETKQRPWIRGVEPPHMLCLRRGWPRARHPRPALPAPGPLEPSSPEYSHPCLRHRRLAPPCRTIPAQQSSRNMSNISVSVKPIPRKSLREIEAARELKSSAWPDVGEASEGQLPQQPPGQYSRPSAPPLTPCLRCILIQIFGSTIYFSKIKIK
jgi:hypothetical protein